MTAVDGASSAGRPSATRRASAWGSGVVPGTGGAGVTVGVGAATGAADVDVAAVRGDVPVVRARRHRPVGEGRGGHGCLLLIELAR